MSLLPNGTIHPTQSADTSSVFNPEEAYLSSVRIYASVAAISSELDRPFGDKFLTCIISNEQVLIWDILDNVVGDYHLLSLNCTFP